MTTASARPAASAEACADRLAAARAGLGAADAAALLVGQGSDLRYLTGHGAHPMERLTMLVLPAAGDVVLVAPRLEAMAAAASAAGGAGLVRVVPWDETDDPYSLVAAQLAATAASGRLLVDSQLWSLHLLGLQRALPGRTFGLATEVTRELRMIKSPDEVDRLRDAARAADRVIEQIAGGRLVGRTEADVSREIGERLVAEGHQVAAFAIVASGPNSASPHHGASDRVIEPGEPIVLDIGGTLDGYCSDTTRSIWVTGGDAAKGPDAEFRTIYDLVRRANEAAGDAVNPGTTCERVDATARNVITEGGYGEAFIHRTGHGIGMDGHEEPYIVAGNSEALRPGTAFSIEPGIYLQGRYGVRIEDIVVCTSDGVDFLNQATRELLVVDG